MYIIRVGSKFYESGDDVDYNYVLTDDKSEAQVFYCIKTAKVVASKITLNAMAAVTILHNLEEN